MRLGVDVRSGKKVTVVFVDDLTDDIFWTEVNQVFFINVL